MEVLFGIPKKSKKKIENLIEKTSFGDRILRFKNFWKKSEQKIEIYQKFLDFKLKMSNKQPNLYYVKHLKLKILPFEMIFFGKPIANLYKFYQNLVEILKVMIKLYEII